MNRTVSRIAKDRRTQLNRLFFERISDLICDDQFERFRLHFGFGHTIVVKYYTDRKHLFDVDQMRILFRNFLLHTREILMFYQVFAGVDDEDLCSANKDVRPERRRSTNDIGCDVFVH